VRLRLKVGDHEERRLGMETGGVSGGIAAFDVWGAPPVGNWKGGFPEKLFKNSWGNSWAGFRRNGTLWFNCWFRCLCQCGLFIAVGVVLLMFEVVINEYLSLVVITHRCVIVIGSVQ